MEAFRDGFSEQYRLGEREIFFRIQRTMSSASPRSLSGLKLRMTMAMPSIRITLTHCSHGGPIILFQPENEYTYGTANVSFPDASYFQEVQDMYRRNGIVVPMISNDAGPYGNNAPGTGKGSIDIYGHDGYPLGFDCSNPYEWPDGALPTNYSAGHLAQSPSTPYTIVEFQGGAFDPWGGVGLEKCATLINEEFERVFYKNNYAAAISIFSLYMGFGG